MVAALILSLHFIAAVYVFFKYKKESTSEGFLAVALFVIVFSVGWTIARMLTNGLYSLEFFEKWYYSNTSASLQKEINRDTIALLLLTAGECGVYYLFLRRTKKEQSKEITSA